MPLHAHSPHRYERVDSVWRQWHYLNYVCRSNRSWSEYQDIFYLHSQRSPEAPVSAHCSEAGLSTSSGQRVHLWSSEHTSATTARGSCSATCAEVSKQFKDDSNIQSSNPSNLRQLDMTRQRKGGTRGEWSVLSLLCLDYYMSHLGAVPRCIVVGHRCEGTSGSTAAAAPP